MTGVGGGAAGRGGAGGYGRLVVMVGWWLWSAGGYGRLVVTVGTGGKISAPTAVLRNTAANAGAPALYCMHVVHAQRMSFTHYVLDSRIRCTYTTRACMVRGAWCMVHGAWCVVHGAWCVVHACAVRGAWCVVRGAWCVMRGE